MIIKNIYLNYKKYLLKEIVIKGWIKSFRNNKFIIINDGSTIKNLQVVIPKNLNINNNILKKITIGTSVKIKGILKTSLNIKQNIELILNNIYIYNYLPGNILKNTILHPKFHKFSELRKQCNLRIKTNIFSSIMRIRHNLSIAIHKFFNKRNFYYIHTPIITNINTEGIGKVFKITTLDNIGKEYDVNNEFFKCNTNLTVSGQLEGEIAALGLGRIYTFGPIFRAENSNTYRHLSEFWMVEPEICFYKLNNIIKLSIYLIKYLIKYVINNCIEDLNYIDLYLSKNNKEIHNNLYSNNLILSLKKIYKLKFIKISYNKIIKILRKNKIHFNKLDSNIKWGLDLNSSHEKFLVNKYFKKPIVIYNYPSNIKPFYMKENKNNNGKYKTVRSMDLLLPNIGELIGGSEREEDENKLIKKMEYLNINKDILWWYIQSRKYGSVPHSGFGMGFDRLVQFITSINNIRDVILCPRTPKNLLF